MQNRFVKIGEAASILGTTRETMRRWEETGELLPARKTKRGTRYYSTADLMGLKSLDAPTICCARVSSRDQKDDRDR